MPENKGVGSYTFTVTRERKLWIFATPELGDMVMEKSLGKFIWLILKKKLRFKK